MAVTGLFIGEIPTIEIVDGIVKLSILDGDRVYCLPVSVTRATLEILRRMLDDFDRREAGKVVPCKRQPPG